MSMCSCGGLVMEPGVTYGWAGKICYCPRPNGQVYSPYLQQWINTLPPIKEVNELKQEISELKNDIQRINN